MKRILSLSAALLAACALVGGANAQEEKKAGPESLVGKPAPEIAGDFALNGKPVKLSDLKGKVVVLDFWAVWCGPCIATIPHLNELQKEFGDKGLEIVGQTYYDKRFGFDKDAGRLTPVKEEPTVAAMQTTLRDFAGHHKQSYRIQSMSRDEWNKIVSGDYGVTGIPTVVVIDKKGVVRLVKIGSGDANAKAVKEEVEKLLAEK
jgi:thiol-disulfide isomerase/thioredoxin